MDRTDLLAGLSPEQRAVVAAGDEPLLVLAGAGSGKTRVLTHRIAWLLAQGRARPEEILAVTFTNKATREMQERIVALVGPAARRMWIGTFHALAHRLLRRHAAAVGLPEGFTILDEDDQKRLVQEIMRTSGIDPERLPAGAVQSFINRHKDEGRRCRDLDRETILPAYRVVYEAYEKRLDALGAVDFAELLLRALELWRRNPDILDEYRRRLRYAFVDEFQDSNTVQYRWLLALVGHGGPLPFAVGDDDQAIYGWRGAHPEHLQRFLDDVPGARLVRLERNYRSHQIILDAANAVIARNRSRLGKRLWSEDRSGGPIAFCLAENEEDEARWVAAWLDARRREAPSSSAVLYRINAQSRPLEEALLARGLPYRLVGAVRFFQRAEIKDALAYLRLLRRPDDDLAFARVVNRPSRGVGDRTLAALEARAAAAGSRMRAALAYAGDPAEPARARHALRSFLDLLERLRADLESLPLPDLVARVVEESGLKAAAAEGKDTTDGAPTERVANLEELVAAAARFVEHAEEEGESLPAEGSARLDAFLAYCLLQTEERGEEATPAEGTITLMSLHAAKGLEFHRVVLVGLNDGLLPHARALDDPRALEEERRLLYVGLTRARRELVLCARRRRVQRSGGRVYELPALPSRFLHEIPSELLATVNGSDVRPETRGSVVGAGCSWKPGDGVRHPDFGDGVITACEEDGGGLRLEIRFRRAGTKWLLAEYARLTRTPTS
jgi:DNA helicase-2/ATP-dependent DNA helicase PcrA